MGDIPSPPAERQAAHAYRLIAGAQVQQAVVLAAVELPVADTHERL